MNVRVCARHTRKQVLAPQAEQTQSNYEAKENLTLINHPRIKTNKQSKLGESSNMGKSQNFGGKPCRRQKQNKHGNTHKSIRQNSRNLMQKYRKSAKHP